MVFRRHGPGAADRGTLGDRDSDQPGGKPVLDVATGAGRPRAWHSRPRAWHSGGQPGSQPLVPADPAAPKLQHFSKRNGYGGGLALGLGPTIRRRPLVAGACAPALGLALLDRRDERGRAGILDPE